MKFLLLGYGNPGRGDDGLGPWLVERLEQQWQEMKQGRQLITFLTAMQLQPEHVFDLEVHDRILLIDAGMGTPDPFVFEQLHPRRDDSFSSHSLSPQTLLAIYLDTLRRQPPPAFLLTVRGENFSLGVPLTPEVLERIDRARDFVCQLLRAPESDWLQQAGRYTGYA